MNTDIALKVSPPNQSQYVIGTTFSFGLSYYGNEEYGPQSIIFFCRKLPQIIIDRGSDELLHEFYIDMLAIFNLINNTRCSSNSTYNLKIDMPDGLYEMSYHSESLHNPKYKYVISNIYKTTYFNKEELGEYVDIYNHQKNFNEVLNFKEFTNNLLLSSINYDVFMVAHLWMEMRINPMYSIINAYKIYEIIKNLKFKKSFEYEECFKIKESYTVSLREIHSKYLGKFANNMGVSGVLGRHGNTTLVEDRSQDIQALIKELDIALVRLIRIYFILITNEQYFLEE